MEHLTALEHLQRSLRRGGATQLGIGPMSVHCVDAVIEVANSLRRPLMLVASRRQVDAECHGGGYVNCWSTESFSAYVRERDRGGYVVLCRDHGGPWQSTFEVEQAMPLVQAMASAKASFDVDIAAGFDILHIDPSVDIHQHHVKHREIIERVCELYEHCQQSARRSGRVIAVEVGAEEQSGDDQDLEAFEELLERVTGFCERSGFPRPLFVVGQTGTLVRESFNVGALDDPFRRADLLPPEIQVPRVVDLCARYGVYLKEHNSDYLSNEALGWHPRLRIHAANIAPEFGVGQTRHLLRVCQEFGLHQEAEDFLELAYASGKWKKWMLPDSQATDRERAIIAGHYVYSTPEVVAIFDRMRWACARHGLDLDASIRDTVKTMIMRYVALFNLVA